VTTPITHPSWCQQKLCGVQEGPTGTPVGAHRSRPVAIGGPTPDELEVRLSLYQIDGRAVFVAFDWDRPGNDVGGLLFDPNEANVIGRVLRDLAALAEREAAR
jgi:hypothetical protein